MKNIRVLPLIILVFFCASCSSLQDSRNEKARLPKLESNFIFAYESVAHRNAELLTRLDSLFCQDITKDIGSASRRVDLTSQFPTKNLSMYLFSGFRLKEVTYEAIESKACDISFAIEDSNKLGYILKNTYRVNSPYRPTKKLNKLEKKTFKDLFEGCLEMAKN